ncbi:hypothetical protein F3I27_06015 [Pantoea sp. Bo_2]|nr:hypothetical protein F3I57_03785 [Pantoea sp. VH_3]KAA5954536.1 hypothetical protein F3I56_05760 [Pantoea sp. VH_25]KAA5958705.1 hypothetical protein F3I55_05165 [Pantoea sp. VH_24]KAA5961932.1 hypothetical protein F3I53_08105 [Pantoea sp. VH_16]KAA5966324.1 hypothetical protein F3I54_06900 [Pantoea sp. VH_18]KAA5983890.1 hypothetical protein F3I48_05790 [Pantoea sp. M_3]KAA6000966.1 hypothetical protein F3I46_06240 [Pantoea sp. M_1]KAA6003629.1 hypothetical protein F3I45_08505 [Pantoea s
MARDAFLLCPCSLRVEFYVAVRSWTGCCCRSSSLTLPQLQLRETTTRGVDRALNILFAVCQRHKACFIS